MVSGGMGLPPPSEIRLKTAGTRMPRKQKPLYVAPGIVRDGNRLVARARAGGSRDGKQLEERGYFALGTPVSVIDLWRREKEIELDKRVAAGRHERGTLAGDIDAWIEKLPANRYRKDTIGMLKHFQSCPLGSRDRHTIERSEILDQISEWVKAGHGANTINKRVFRLRALYHALDGITSANPTEKIKKQPEPDPDHRDISPRIVQAILDSIVDMGRAARGGTRPTFSVTKIRLRVMAWIGHSQATIVKIRPRDLDLKRARAFLRPRRKGKPAEFGSWVPLLPQAVDALRDFANAKTVDKAGNPVVGLFGLTWSNSSAGDSWRTGIELARPRVEREAAESGDESWIEELDRLPPRCKPYDLRHSFATEVFRRSDGDLKAVKALLLHSQLKTSERYMMGAVDERAQNAITRAGTSYAAVPKLPAPVAKPAPTKRGLRLVKTAAS